MNLTSPANLHVRYTSPVAAGPTAVDVRFAEGAAWREWTAYYDRSTARKAMKRLAQSIGRKALVIHRADGSVCSKVSATTGHYQRVR